ncbi:GntR family transcriptional regulator [Arthrobacter sp. StoSoilB22]|nr:GntR family transcriptional regulator [Arthrobacter sp. StoSoilB22]
MINMDSAVQRVYLDVSDRLASGELPPGKWVRERSLAEAMGVSRTPVREALNKLAAEGLVRLERNRGAQVVEWTSEQITEIYGLRAATEGFIASVAAQKIDDDTLDKLEVNLDQYARMIQEGDVGRSGAAALNAEFHATVVAAARNETLTNLASGVINNPLARRTFLRYSPRDLQRSYEHHRQLVEALRDHDSEAASMIMHVHILSAQRASLKSERPFEGQHVERP